MRTTTVDTGMSVMFTYKTLRVAAWLLVTPASTACARPSPGLASETGAEETIAPSRAPSSPPRDVATAVATAPSAAPSSHGSPPEPSTRRYVVAAIGDSLTDPKSHGGKYLKVLADKCPESRFDSYGVGGNMVNQMRKRFLNDVFGPGLPRTAEGEAPPAEKERYTHLLVLGGINDICSDESALRTNDKIKRDLSWMYAEARKRDVKVIALTLPPWAGFTRFYNPRREASTFDMNRWIAGADDRGEVDAVFDTYPRLSCGEPTFLCKKYGWPDEVHWSKEGHRVIGEALHEALFADCR